MTTSGPAPTEKTEITSTEFTGEIQLAGTSIPCAVLYPESESPVRVFIMREVVGLLTGNKKGGLDRYLNAGNLKKFVPVKFQEKQLSESTVNFKYKGRTAQGFYAEDLIDICAMYMDAEQAGVLHASQLHLANQARAIVFAFAKTGVAAVIDEATGYQEVRERHALQLILDKYVTDEYSKWTRRFPLDFYRLMFKLNGWDISNGVINKRPGIIGTWTNTYVYGQLEKGVLKRLQEVNPKDPSSGNRKHKHHQFLTQDLGIPELTAQIHQVMGIMRVSKNWKHFKEQFARAFGQQSLFDGDDE